MCTYIGEKEISIYGLIHNLPNSFSYGSLL